MGDPAASFGKGCAGLYGATQADAGQQEAVAERCGLWCDRVGYIADSVRDFVNANLSNAFEARNTVDGCLDFMARNTALEGVENIFDAKALPLEVLRFLCLSQDPRLPEPPLSCMSMKSLSKGGSVVPLGEIRQAVLTAPNCFITDSTLGLMDCTDEWGPVFRNCHQLLWEHGMRGHLVKCQPASTLPNLLASVLS